MFVTTGTNNTAELTALGEALLWLRDFALPNTDKVTITYDSEYAKNAVDGTNKVHANKALVYRIQEVYRHLTGTRRVRILWNWVKGHASNAGNIEADALANRGATGATCTEGRYAPPSSSSSRAAVAPPAAAPGAAASAVGLGSAPSGATALKFHAPQAPVRHNCAPALAHLPVSVAAIPSAAAVSVKLAHTVCLLHNQPAMAVCATCEALTCQSCQREQIHAGHALLKQSDHVASFVQERIHATSAKAQVCVCVCEREREREYASVYACMYVCVNACMYVCILKLGMRFFICPRSACCGS
jgi:ribonuclease HI